MAEFCVDCWNKIMDTNDPKKKFILSRELDLCEECGNYRQVIVAFRKRYLLAEWINEIANRKRGSE